jgi:DNA polymerase-1
MNISRVIVDTDSIVYRSASSYTHDLIQAIDATNYYIDKIWYRFNSKPILFLSGSDNFRFTVDHSYKANRIGKTKPRFYQNLRDYLVMEWNAEIINGYEADDILGVLAGPDSIICTIDKDLNTVPGRKYNYVTDEYYETSEDEAAYYFFKQVLMGDSVDNVRGLPGIGEKKASNVLEGLSVKDYKSAVIDKYKEVFLKKKLGTEQDALEEFDRTARLIFIKRGKLTSEYTDYY